VNNIAGKRLNEADKSEDVVSAWKDAYKDLGYNLDVKYTTGEDTPEMKNKAGTAYVSKDEVHTIIININTEENSTKAGLIGTLAEEASHIVNGAAGRQIETGTDEKGLESTGRASNAYFKEEYKGSNQNMTYKSDGEIDTSKLGTNVGNLVVLDFGKNSKLEKKYKEMKENSVPILFFNEIRDSIINNETNKLYDEETFRNIMNDLKKLIRENKILKDMNSKNILEKLDKAMQDNDLKSVVDPDTGDYIVEIGTSYKGKPDMATIGLRNAIEDKNYTTILKETENTLNPYEIEFLKNFEEKIKNSKLPKEKKEGLLKIDEKTGLKMYEKKWKETFLAGNFSFNDGKTSFVYVNITGQKPYLTAKYNNKNIPIGIETNERTPEAVIAHEVGGHSNDNSAKINNRLKKGEKYNYQIPENVEIYEDKNRGLVYSTNNYIVNEEEGKITFFGVKDREFNAFQMENSIQKKPRIGTHDVSDTFYDINKINITVKYTGNIKKDFETIKQKNNYIDNNNEFENIFNKFNELEKGRN